MAIVLALPRLYDAVAARFTAESFDVAMAFGWRTPFAQVETVRRIVWVPGDPSGDMGDVSPPKYPGRNPRPLLNLAESFYCDLSAVDVTASEDERSQYQATRELYCVWLRAVHLEAHGTYAIESSEWLIGKNARRFGAAIRVVASIQSVVFDQPLQGVDANAGRADLTLAALEVTETLSVVPA
jgi:hypothetical protein